MTDQAKETMHKVMDRKKILKSKTFRCDSYSGESLDFETWQRSNPELQVVHMQITERMYPGAQTDLTQPPRVSFETHIHIVYAIYEKTT